jgi:hypothetical protein
MVSGRCLNGFALINTSPISSTITSSPSVYQAATAYFLRPTATSAPSPLTATVSNTSSATNTESATFPPCKQ